MADTIRFRERSLKLDWTKIDAVDFESQFSVEALQNNLMNVTFSNLDNEIQGPRSEELIKVFKLSQFIIEYLLMSQDYLQDSNERLSQENNRIRRDFNDYKEKLGALETKWLDLNKYLMENKRSDVQKCSFCGKLFYSPLFLQLHLEKRHQNEIEHVFVEKKEANPISKDLIYKTDLDLKVLSESQMNLHEEVKRLQSKLEEYHLDSRVQNKSPRVLVSSEVQCNLVKMDDTSKTCSSSVLLAAETQTEHNISNADFGCVARPTNESVQTQTDVPGNAWKPVLNPVMTVKDRLIKYGMQDNTGSLDAIQYRRISKEIQNDRSLQSSNCSSFHSIRSQIEGEIDRNLLGQPDMKPKIRELPRLVSPNENRPPISASYESIPDGCNDEPIYTVPSNEIQIHAHDEKNTPPSVSRDALLICSCEDDTDVSEYILSVKEGVIYH